MKETASVSGIFRGTIEKSLCNLAKDFVKSRGLTHTEYVVVSVEICAHIFDEDP